MNKIISFSLWGSDNKYIHGAQRNIELAKRYFPDWKIRLYYNGTLSEEFNKYDNVEFIDCNQIVNFSGYFWRYLSAFEDDNNICLFRDCDSRLSERELYCVNKWFETDNKFLVIRDHANHYEFPMLAGMWGFRGKLTNDILDEMKRYATQHFYLVDQFFLRDIVWPMAQNDSTIIGIHEDVEFGTSRVLVGKHFIGQTYDENDNPVYDA